MRKTILRPLVVREIDRLIASKAAWMTQRYGLQPADTQDIRQEAWVAALKALPGYNKAGSTLDTYLTPYVTYAMLDASLAIQARGMTGTGMTELDEPVDLESVAGSEEADDDDAPEDRVSSPVPLQDLLVDPGMADLLLAQADAASAIAKLDPRTRQLLILYFGLSGQPPLTLKDLARRNRQKIGVIYRRIQRGLDSLRDQLEQQDTEE